MIGSFPRAEVVTPFGQTERSPITTTLRGKDALRKIGSVGTPVLNVGARAVDEDMNDVPRGQVGGIVHREPTVTKEHRGKPRETAEVFRGGCFRSGDPVRQDEEGYCYPVDREKEVITSGGENIGCVEVEDVLTAHPKVSEVALIGVADPKWGEIPLAVVVPRQTIDPPTAHDVDGWCRERPVRYKASARWRPPPHFPRSRRQGPQDRTPLRARGREHDEPPCRATRKSRPMVTGVVTRPTGHRKRPSRSTKTAVPRSFSLRYPTPKLHKRQTRHNCP